MATPTMKHQVPLPGGAVANKLTARLRVIATDDLSDGFGHVTASNLSIGGARTFRYDGDGVVNLGALHPTSGSSGDVIDSPTGCVYELVTTWADGRSVTVFFTVPDTAGTYWVHDYLADPPSAVTAQLGHGSLTGRSTAGAHPSTAVTHGSASTVSAALEAVGVRPANLHFSGHSYLNTIGVGATNSGRSTDHRLAGIYGVDPGRVSNLATSGAALRGAERAGAAKYLQALNPGVLDTRPLVGHVGLAVCWWGTNDAVLGTSTANLDAFEAGYTALVARYLAAGVYDYNDSSVASSGSWSTTLYSSVDPPWGSGSGVSISSSVGASKTITLPSGVQSQITASGGAWVDLTFVTAYADSGCTITITRDGSTYGTKTMRRAFWTDEHGLDVARVWCPAGTTTVAFSITSCTAGAIRFDCWSVEAATTPAVALLEMVLPSDPQWVWAGIDQDTCDAFNARIDDVVELFADTSVSGARDVTSVFKVSGLNEVLGEGDDEFFHDGLHPNDAGCLRIAQTVASHVAGLVAEGTLERKNFSAWWYGEVDPLTSAEFAIVRGDGDPQELVDDFGRDDATTIGGSGWTQAAGGWGILAGQAALYEDRFPWPSFTDDFARSDSATAVGNGWTATSGTWGISSGEAYFVSGSAGFLTSPNTLTSGDGWLGYTAAGTIETGAGIFFRYSDANNYWRAVWNAVFGTWVLVKVEAGVATTALNPIHTGDYQDGHEFAVVLNGTTMTFFVDGVQVNTHTSSFNENATACGIIHTGSGGGAYRWDDWRQSSTVPDFSVAPAFGNVLLRDLGTTTGAVSFTVGQDRANFVGCVFRWVDDENYLTLYESTTYGVWVLQKCIAGVTSTVVLNMGGSTATGTVVTILMVSSTTFRVYFNGTEYSSGLITIADAPAGTYFGFRAPFELDLPFAGWDNVMFGDALASVSDGQWYRNDQSGALYGPFEDGVPADEIPWLPENLTTAGLTASAVPFTPTGTIASTNVQAAIAEVASEAGGAPTDATYVTLSSNGTLSAEAVLGTAVVMAGTTAARPAAGTAGRVYFATDDDGGTLFRDNGSSWVQIAGGLTEYLTTAAAAAGYQPLDADLTAIAALSTTAYGRSLLTLANAAALGTELAAIYQPLDADLTSIAALTTTAFGRSLLEAANAAALRTLADSPSNSEAVLDTLFDANTILKADSDNTPEALTVAEQTVVGRITGGEITALTASEVRTLLDVPTNAQAILDALIDAKGDLIVGTAADTPARQAAGADHTVLTYDSTQSNGVRGASTAPVMPFACSMPPGFTNGVGAMTSNNDGHYFRSQGGGSHAALAIHVGTQNGNVSVAAYTNSGSGRSAAPTGGQLATSGSVACPASGYAEVSLGATVTIRVDDWVGLSASSNTATFGGLAAGTSLTSAIADGSHLLQTTAHPLPATPSSLSGIGGRNYAVIGES